LALLWKETCNSRYPPMHLKHPVGGIVYTYVHVCVHVYVCKYESCRRQKCYMHGCVMPHIWICDATYVNVWWDIYECAMLHVWIRDATHTNVWCHTATVYECVMVHIPMCDATRTNVSCHTYECVTPHIWKCDGAQVNAWCYMMLHDATWMYQCVMLHIWIRQYAYGVHNRHSVCVYKYTCIYIRVLLQSASCYIYAIYMNVWCHTNQYMYMYMYMYT